MSHRDGVKKGSEMMDLTQQCSQCMRVIICKIVEPIDHKLRITKNMYGIAVNIPGKCEKKSKALQFGKVVCAWAQAHFDFIIVLFI